MKCKSDHIPFLHKTHHSLFVTCSIQLKILYDLKIPYLCNLNSINLTDHFIFCHWFSFIPFFLLMDFLFALPRIYYSTGFLLTFLGQNYHLDFNLSIISSRETYLLFHTSFHRYLCVYDCITLGTSFLKALQIFVFKCFFSPLEEKNKWCSSHWRWRTNCVS